ncbi:MAG: TCR/Tet family MFS transporter [Saprospiraceae bacterium]|nr:TCR/Tet family MFS transporter [Saprospiraceae bacterium]
MPRALTFIFITVLIDIIGLGIIIPVLPQLIQELSGKPLGEASSISGWMSFVFSSALFICAPVMGGISDRFGRRPVLLFSLFGFGMDYLLQAYAPSLFWLFVGRFLAGVTGSSFTTATSYIADVSPPEKKAQNFGLVGAAFGLGFIIGPSLGALLGQYGTRIPFFGAAILAFANLIFGYFVLPESLKPENRRAFDWRRANPFGTFKVLFKYPVFKIFLVTLFLVYIAHYALQSTWSFYCIGKFGWDSKMIGFSLAVVGVMVAIVQGGLTRIIIPRLGSKKSIYLGLTISTLGYISYAFATEGWMMFAITVPFAFGGLTSPTVQGLISNQVPVNAQGELQAGITGLMSLSAIVGPLIMTGLFSYFTRFDGKTYFPGAPFLAAGILVFVGILLILKPLSKLDAS